MVPLLSKYINRIFSPICRFSVKLWQATSVHGHGIASQSGCKLIAYTTTGMAHAISYLLLALVIYAYKGMNAADFRYNFMPKMGTFQNLYQIQLFVYNFSYLDGGIKKNAGWIVCCLFALEGVFGMVPAIHMDVASDGSKCNSTQTLVMSVEAFVSVHMLFQSILPYLFPFVLMIFPLTQMIIHFRSISDVFIKDLVRNVLVLACSYIITYTPLALLAIIIFPTILQ